MIAERRRRRRRNGIDRLTKMSTRHAKEEVRFTATVTGDAEGIELRVNLIALREIRHRADFSQ